MKWLMILALAAMVWADPAQDNIRFQIAKKFEEKGDLDRALLDYQNFLVEEPKSQLGYLALGRVYNKKKALGQAALQYQKVLELNPQNTSALQSLAEVRERQGAKEKAIGHYRQLASVSPAKKPMAEKKIKSLMQSKAQDKSSKVSNIKSSTGGFDYQSPLFLEGRRLSQAGKDKEALQVWRKLLKREPGHPGAYYFAGQNRYNLKDYKNAAINFKRGYSYPEKGHNSHYYLGRIAERQGKSKDAIRHYNNYLSKTSYAKGIEEVKGRIAQLKKSTPSSQGTSDPKGDESPQVKSDSSSVKDSNSQKPQKAATNQPYKIESLNTTGFYVFQDEEAPGAEELTQAWLKYRRSKVDDAIEILKKITLNYPASANALAAHYNLASLHHELGLNKNVLTISRMILRNSPPEPYRSSLYYLMAQSEFEAGSKKKALDYLASIKTDGLLGPSSAKKLSFEADLARQLDQGESGIAKMKLAIDNAKTDDKKRILMYDLARMYIDKAKVSEGVQVYRDMLAKCPKGANEELCRRACVGIADENFKLKNWDVAQKYYQKTLEEFEDPKDSPWAQYQLGNIHVEKGKYSEAVKAYNLVSEKYSDSYWASQATWKRDDTIWRKEYEGVLSK